MSVVSRDNQVQDSLGKWGMRGRKVASFVATGVLVASIAMMIVGALNVDSPLCAIGVGTLSLGVLGKAIFRVPRGLKDQDDFEQTLEEDPSSSQRSAN